jgi:alpha-D-ribose 1-methylphosphonate 5-triphosphate synthase subunit PhnH
MQSLSIPELRSAIDSVHDTQAVFRVVLEALSRPGSQRRVPVAAADAPSNPWLTAVLLTLLDHEVSFVAVSEAATETFVRARTNARPAALSDADFVLANIDSLTPDGVRALKRGSLAYPDESATLIADVRKAAGDVYRLAGPGIQHEMQCRLALNDSVVEALVEVNANYPCGIDVLLVDTEGRLTGLPRTTRIGGL